MSSLNHGQGIFEGMKAFRTVDGEVVTFRPDQNAARFAEGAGRMSMPAAGSHGSIRPHSPPLTPIHPHTLTRRRRPPPAL